jgi:peptide deformylase
VFAFREIDYHSCMPARRILQMGDPALRQRSLPVESPAEAESVLCDLRDTLHEFQRRNGFGRGISAIQIGVPLRVIYVEIDGVPHRLINPEFEWKSDEAFRLWDDCFSFPNLLVWLERSVAVRLRYLDDLGESRNLEARGAFSELLQHEMDHLDGILAVDRALDRDSLCTREEFERRFGST